MERSCTVSRVTQKQSLSWKVHKNKNKYFHGKELHCKPSYTKINTLIDGKELHCKPCYTKTNTFVERSCTVNLLTQK